MQTEEKEEIMENLSAYLPFRHICFMASDCGIKRKSKASQGAEETKLAVSENYVNIRYWNSQVIRNALAYTMIMYLQWH